MGVYFELAYWLYLPQLWVIAGLMFILLELTDGSAVFFLPMGLASLLLAALLKLQEQDALPYAVIPQAWYWLLAFWIGLALVCFVAISRLRPFFFKRQDDNGEDINQY